MYILNELTYINNTSLALGYFDGLHQGHRVVLKTAQNAAKKLGCKSCVIIFKNHPSEILTNNKIEQILTLDEKLNMLNSEGIDYVMLMDFNDYHNIKAQDYIENILIKYFSPKAITTGFNHTFGYKREGNCKFLENNQKKYGYEYYAIPPYVINNTIVSSSAIRNRLKLADFFSSDKLLGYKYFIQGQVIKGEQLASKLGFPSANIEYPESKVKVPHGVYYTKVIVNNKEYNGIYNYGIVKGSDGNEKLKSEVHILDFNDDIYGENIKISFIAKIRNQSEFQNIDKLKEQIKRDAAFVQIYKHFVDTTVTLPCKKFLM